MIHVHRCILVLWVLGSLVFPGSGAAHALQPEADLQTLLRPGQTAALVGERVAWVLQLTPTNDQPVENVELSILDEQSWRLVSPLPMLPLLETGRAVHFTAIPLRTGSLNLTLLVRYRSQGATREILAPAGEKITVTPVETQVAVSLLPVDQVVRGQEPTQAAWSITNTTPFTLTEVTFEGLGSGVAWETPAVIAVLAPHAAAVQTVAFSVTGATNPSLLGRVTYLWTDDAGALHHAEALLPGDPPELAKGFLGDLPASALGVLAGVVVGALTSLITGTFTERREAARKRKMSQDRLSGLIHLAVIQIRGALKANEPADLDLLKTVYKEEGLYDRARDKAWFAPIQAVLENGVIYNNDLDTPGGAAQRHKELSLALDELEKTVTS